MQLDIGLSYLELENVKGFLFRSSIQLNNQEVNVAAIVANMMVWIQYNIVHMHLTLRGSARK